MIDLPFNRWDEVTGVGAPDGPLKGMTLHPDSVAHMLCVVDETSTVKGYWPLFPAVHAEPLFLDPSVRLNVAVARQLIEAVLTKLQQNAVPYVFGIIGDGDVEINAPLAEKFGFIPIPGKLYGCEIPLAPTTPEEDA